MLIIAAEHLAQIEKHAEQGYPYEICGALLGHFEDAMATRKVLEVCPAENINQERANDRYEINPKDYQDIESRARTNKMDIVGIYHSHPDHPSLPSETDRQRAAEIWQTATSWSYIIVEVNKGQATSTRSWVLRDEEFHGEDIVQGEVSH